MHAAFIRLFLQLQLLNPIIHLQQNLPNLHFLQIYLRTHLGVTLNQIQMACWYRELMNTKGWNRNSLVITIRKASSTLEPFKADASIKRSPFASEKGRNRVSTFLSFSHFLRDNEWQCAHQSLSMYECRHADHINVHDRNPFFFYSHRETCGNDLHDRPATASQTCQLYFLTKGCRNRGT